MYYCKATALVQWVYTLYNIIPIRLDTSAKRRAGLCNSPGPMVVVITLLRMSVIYNI